jgi:hypothetical protein
MIRIDVTADDCNSGVRGSSMLCPVVRAIKRRVRGPVRIENADAVWLGDRMAWLPPEEAYRVQTFDRTGEMMPHSFDLDTSVRAYPPAA